MTDAPLVLGIETSCDETGVGIVHGTELLVDAGLGASTLTARWHLGGPREGALAARADEWNLARTPDLVVACLEVRAAPTAGFRFDALGPAPGRPEDAFAHDGQITKRDVRASALAHLRPAPGAHLWDLGAGSGAIGLEWCLAAPGARCTAVERDPGRAGRAGDNSIRHGVAERHAVVVGDSADPAVLTTLGSPDAVFVGGGLSAELLDRVVAALPRGGRLVAHAVTLESEGLLVAAQDATDSLLALAKASDILVVACKADETNRGLISQDILEALGPDGLLVNVARGQLVDEDALIAALVDGRIAGAGLDVYAQEPHVPQALLDAPNATLLPHLGTATDDTRTRMGLRALANLQAHIDGGVPPDLVR